VRLRVLPLLLALTAADYALWDWSIADGHDIVSLVAGLTLLPLAAATLALLAVGAGRLLSFALERPAGSRRRLAGNPAKRRGASDAGLAAPPETPAHAAEQAQHEPSSRRLAA
jgi:hypothetical protein